MWPGRGKGTPGSVPKREVALEGRPEGHRPGSNTWAPSPRTKRRVASSSSEGTSCLTHQMSPLGAPSLLCSTEEVLLMKWDLRSHRKSTPS